MPTLLTVAGNSPQLAGTAFLAETATVIGDVHLGDRASVWYGSVLRAEYAPITVGAESNLQDLTVVHTDPGFGVTIGDRVTVGHRCILHGCTIEDDALIGMGATIMNGAVIGEGAVVGAGAVVTEGTVVPPHSLIVGVPGKVKEGASVPDTPRPNVPMYVHLAEAHADATPSAPTD